MKVPGIEEMIKTGEAAFSSDLILTLPRKEMRRFLLAVFETHVKGILRDAYVAGVMANVTRNTGRMPQDESDESYAERILAQLKDPRHA